MLTFTPKKYRPFIRRMAPVLLGALLMPLIMSIIAYRQYTFIYNVEMGGVLSLFIIPVGMYFGIYNLDSIVIDEKRKTIHIQIRKFNKIIDKGEYPIDNDLVVELVKKRSGAGVYYRYLFMYKGERIVPSCASGDGCPTELFSSVCNEVEKIKRTNISVQGQN